jgi:hypothetical protein
VCVQQLDQKWVIVDDAVIVHGRNGGENKVREEKDVCVWRGCPTTKLCTG